MKSTKLYQKLAKNETPEFEFVIYLAGPFFNDEQRALVKNIETLLASIKPTLKVFSPSRDGTVCPPDATREVRKKAYESNVLNVRDADLVVALIDDKDTGTVYEMGMAAAIGVPILAYAKSSSHKLNLMLAEGFQCYAKDHDMIRKFIDAVVKVKLDTFNGHQTIRTKSQKLDKDIIAWKEGVAKENSEYQFIRDALVKESESMIDATEKNMEALRTFQDETIFNGEIE